MRLPIIAAIAAFLTLFSTVSASAQVNGTREALQFVEETKLTDPAGQPISVCHLVEHRVFLFLPIYTSSISYALGENRCDTDRYGDLSAQELKYQQGLGNISADLSSVPSLGTGTVIKNYIVLTIGGLAILFGLVVFIRRKYREIMG